MLMVCAAVLPLVGAAAEPEVVYVTDELRLGLYRTEETSGRTVKTLISGARLTVLERALMSIRVRTDDGDEGWVKTAYIVEAEPARSRLARVEAAAAVTTTQLADTEAALADRKAEVVRLKEELAAAEQAITDLPALREENAALRDTLNAGGTRVPLAWFIAATLIGFLIGGLVGYWLLDRRVRSRFGGLRVY
jgi:SH3 domain protein